MAMPGGLKPAEIADPEIQAVADAVRADLEGKLGSQCSEYVAVTYRSQVVAGINYFIKVKVGPDAYVHLRVYKHFSGEISLASYQDKKTKDDEVTYFSGLGTQYTILEMSKRDKSITWSGLMPRPGGLKPAESADPKIQAVADAVRADLEGKLGSQCSEYVAVTYRLQKVAGINYFIKVKVGPDAYVHLRVYKRFTGEISLTSYQDKKTKDDEVTYF
ncbi:uncharacterized protein LOC135337194 [Halichondria panicea]|uniref:uncharacterized protein LOC135337194 n=1 Tax=Halichondria panicea TaxID=6063 RepID=UPI00312B71C7